MADEFVIKRWINMSIEAADITNYGAGAFITAGGLFWILRWVIRAFHVDTLAIKSSHAEVNVIDRLESEITRLEAIITKQQTQISEMSDSQRNLEKLLQNQRAVLVAIEMIIDSSCTCNVITKGKLSELVSALTHQKDAQ